FFLAAAAFVLAACGGDASTDDATDTTDPAADATEAPADAEGPLVVYTGRSQSLVDAAVDRFREETGMDIEVRYGSDAEILAALQEEGDASPADVFWANTAGALGAAVEAGLFESTPDSLLERPEAFVPSGGQWVPVTARFRTLAYDPGDIDPATLPASVLDIPQQSGFDGRMGWTPQYSSFQDFITALQITEGEEAARQWVEGVQALNPVAYTSNTAMLEALAAGDIDVALTNHYYILRVTEADSTDTDPVATHRFAPGDVGNLALVTGAGVLGTSDKDNAAAQFLSFLLSETSQRSAAEDTYEYPVVGLDTPGYLVPLDDARQLGPEIDFEQLRDIDGTLALLRDQGLL
ncbi:MAG: extracellular solute-binding protein, partial [Bacteroidota bacterium]